MFGCYILLMVQKSSWPVHMVNMVSTIYHGFYTSIKSVCLGFFNHQQHGLETGLPNPIYPIYKCAIYSLPRHAMDFRFSWWHLVPDHHRKSLPRVEVENGEYIWELKHGVILEDCVIAYKWWAMITLLGTHISSKEAHQRSETKGHEVLEPTSSVRYLHEDRTRSLQKRRWKHTCFNGHKLIRWEIRGYCFKEPPGFPGKFRTISLTWKNQ